MTLLLGWIWLERSSHCLDQCQTSKARSCVKSTKAQRSARIAATSLLVVLYLVERRQITGSGGWQCEDRHAIRVLARHLLPKLSGASVLPAASASIPLERRIRRVGQRGGYMSDSASSLVSSPKSKERCVNAILSAESNIEDAGLAHYRDSGLVQVILCEPWMPNISPKRSVDRVRSASRGGLRPVPDPHVQALLNASREHRKTMPAALEPRRPF